MYEKCKNCGDRLDNDYDTFCCKGCKMEHENYAQKVEAERRDNKKFGHKLFAMLLICPALLIDFVFILSLFDPLGYMDYGVLLGCFGMFLFGGFAALVSWCVWYELRMGLK